MGDNDAHERAFEVFNSGGVYTAGNISKASVAKPSTYADKMLSLKLGMVESLLGKDAVALDLCCSTGLHLLELSGKFRHGIGIDFSREYLLSGHERMREAGAGNVDFVCADASMMPLGDAACDVVYSLSSLYVIPQIERVVAEISRILKPGGKCVLDLGNSRSLNACCLKYYPEYARLHAVSVGETRRMLDRNGLRILRHRSFQLLPLWAGRPGWLKPLLWTGWNRMMSVFICGRMLDEWISSLPLVRGFAFRHLFVCERQ